MLEELAADPDLSREFRCRGASFRGLFDNAYLEALSDFSEMRAGVESRSPAITCSSGTVLSLRIVAGDAIEDVETHEIYFVKREEPDGTGVSQLILRR